MISGILVTAFLLAVLFFSACDSADHAKQRKDKRRWVVYALEVLPKSALQSKVLCLWQSAAFSGPRI